MKIYNQLKSLKYEKLKLKKIRHWESTTHKTIKKLQIKITLEFTFVQTNT